MDLGRLALGLVFLGLGASQMKKGVDHIQKGLGKGPAPEKDRRGALPRRLGSTSRGGMTMTVYEAPNLEARINAIRNQVRKGKVDPQVIAWARRQVTQRCPQKPGGWCVPEKDTLAEIQAVFAGLRRDVRYTSDVRGIDTYAHPKRTLQMRAGDCDDAASLGCAALEAIGIPCRLKVIRTNGASSWDHIYIEAGYPKHAPQKWLPLDASMPVRAGWEAPKSMVAATRVFEIDS